MQDPTLCCYHSHCQDGYSSAWAVWTRYQDTIKYYAATHGEPPPDVTGEHVVMVDFSYKAPVLREMAAKAASITVLDHHKSAEADLAPLLADGTIGGLFDMNRSGAVITWEYFHETEVPVMLQHVQDRDLWRFNLPDTRAISACIFSHEYDFETWDYLVTQCASPSGLRQMVAEGSAIERKQQKDIRELLKVTQREMKIGGVVVPVANLPYTMASDAAHIMSQNAPFAACYTDRADGRVFSLRSSDAGADVSMIASQYGGGGHRNASGFKAELGWEGEPRLWLTR
jgi:oligoribonuclease NrnB/cAMP/cGMP phosphodiesterase (DHH superfamily)